LKVKEVAADHRERNMAKKSIREQFRGFVEASPAESNKPMTGGEIARAMVKKKAKGARALRAIETAKAGKNRAKKSKTSKPR
jgi:hypothetical protein